MRHFHTPKGPPYLVFILLVSNFSTVQARLPATTPVNTVSKAAEKSLEFTATPVQEGVLLTWEMGNEAQWVAFKLWQAHIARGHCQLFSARTQVTQLTPAIAVQGEGTTYSYQNKNLSIQDCYSLEYIDLKGQSEFYLIGPGIETWLKLPDESVP